MYKIYYRDIRDDDSFYKQWNDVFLTYRDAERATFECGNVSQSRVLALDDVSMIHEDFFDPATFIGPALIIVELATERLTKKQ